MKPTGSGDRATMIDVSISLGAANLIALSLTPAVALILLLLYWQIWGSVPFSRDASPLLRPFVLIPVFALSVVAHEMLHALGFVWFGGVALAGGPLWISMERVGPIRTLRRVNARVGVSQVDTAARPGIGRAAVRFRLDLGHRMAFWVWPPYVGSCQRGFHCHVGDSKDTIPGLRRGPSRSAWLLCTDGWHAVGWRGQRMRLRAEVLTE